MFDKEVTRQQIQSLNDIEAIIAFFAYLGYDTNSRVQQTPANLGITAETVQRQIKRIERMADQQGLLSVYLIEMTSVTVAGIQGIIRPLRNRAGQYLFVLTSDYEQIDFVLLQRVTPEGEGKGLTQKQVGVRPRVLTVDRCNPDPVLYGFSDDSAIRNWIRLLNSINRFLLLVWLNGPNRSSRLPSS